MVAFNIVPVNDMYELVNTLTMYVIDKVITRYSICITICKLHRRCDLQMLHIHVLYKHFKNDINYTQKSIFH